MQETRASQDEMYQRAAGEYGAALERLARAYEDDAEVRRDLLQDIHVALWRSFAVFNGRCSLRTWVHRVAHNVATSHVIRQRRTKVSTLVGLEELQSLPDQTTGAARSHRNHVLEKLLQMIQRLKPLDRQVILSYLEGLHATEIAEITGISALNVATKIHRIKRILARSFQEDGQDAE
jgi:RNA polymerase sigma-70 factor (ECF subfamily)